MAWFFYSVILPIMALSVALAGCVIYWWIRERELNGVAKRPSSAIEEDSATVTVPVTGSNFR